MNDLVDLDHVLTSNEFGIAVVGADTLRRRIDASKANKKISSRTITKIVVSSWCAISRIARKRGKEAVLLLHVARVDLHGGPNNAVEDCAGEADRLLDGR